MRTLKLGAYGSGITRLQNHFTRLHYEGKTGLKEDAGLFLRWCGHVSSVRVIRAGDGDATLAVSRLP